MTDAATRSCPDCGTPNALDAASCVECSHPIAPAEIPAPVAPRLRRPGPRVTGSGLPGAGKVIEEQGKVIPRRRHTKVGVLGVGGEGRTGLETAGGSWIWLIVGGVALVAVLVAAIGITTREPPFGVPGASPVQANLADSLHQALKSDSLNAEGFIRLANLLYDTQNYERAVPIYRRALRVDPSLADARVDLAVSLHQSGRSGEALAELNRVLREDPGHAVARFDLAVIYEFMERLDEAEAEYRKVAALDIQPELAHAVEQRLRAVQAKREQSGS